MKSTPLNLRIPPKLKAILVKQAKREGRTISDIVKRALKDAFQK